MDDEIAVIHEDPVCGLVSFDLAAVASRFMQLLLHTVGHGLYLVGVASACDDKIIC